MVFAGGTYHSFYPVFEGLSEQSYDPDPAASVGLDNDAVYEQNQKQRYYERKVRESRRDCATYAAARDAATDPLVKQAMDDEFTRSALLLKKREARLNDYVRDTDSILTGDRIITSGYNKSVSSSVTWAVRRAKEEADYNKIIKPYLPKVASADDVILPETVYLDSGVVKGIIPKKNDVTSVHVLAGYGSSEHIRDSKRLVAQHGGESYKWSKRTGVVEGKYFTYEIHWYQNGKKQVDHKVKGTKPK